MVTLCFPSVKLGQLVSSPALLEYLLELIDPHFLLSCHLVPYISLLEDLCSPEDHVYFIPLVGTSYVTADSVSDP